MSFYDEILSGESFKEPENTATAVIDVDTVLAGEAMAETEGQIEALIAVEAMRTNTLAKMVEVEEKHKDVELTGEARELYVETLATLGGIYGFVGEEDTSFKDKAKSVLKSLQIYARKFIAIVGKWIAKASTYFTGLDSTRKDLLEAVKKASASTEIELSESLISKLKSFFGGDKKVGGLPAIGLFMKPKPAEGVIDVNKIKEIYKDYDGVDKVEGYVKDKCKDGNECTGFATELADGSILLEVKINDKPGGKTLSSKLFTLPFKFDSLNLKPGKVKLGDLNLDLKELETELSMKPADLRKQIDEYYKLLKDTLDIGDIKEGEDPVAIKTAALNLSKAYYKYMMGLVGRWRAAIKTAKIIKDGKDGGEKKEEKEEK